MTANEDSAVSGIRLHVGGLGRGVDPTDLAALIARALPDGTTPVAEIMKDNTTGMERGFGYVSVPPGEGVRAGAERAIQAYNGTRWRGNRIKIGFAKGGYMERLKGEWEDAAKAEELSRAAVAEAAATAPSHASYKPRPCLRLRKRAGERVILVDPTPIPWTKPSLDKLSSQDRRKKQNAKGVDNEENESKIEEAEAEGREGGHEEGHRRKRGVLGARQRVVFPGRTIVTKTKCRDLWRKHLQERAAEASAARLRSVDRLISADERGSRNTAVPNHSDRNKPDDSVTSNGGRGAGKDKGKIQESAEFQAEGDRDGNVTMGEEEDETDSLAPEEPPAPEGIEFVWDDNNDGSGLEDGGDDQDEEHQDEGENDLEDNSSMQSDLPARQEGEELNEARDDEGRGVLEANHGVLGEGSKEEEEEEESADDEDAQEGDDDVLDGRVQSERMSDKQSKRERLKNSHGLEIDDRLAAFLSSDEEEEEEDGDDRSGHDYEMATAHKAELELGSAMSSAFTSAPGKDVSDGVGDVQEKLKAETERSLNVLAELFGDMPSTRSPASKTTSAALAASGVDASSATATTDTRKDDDGGGTKGLHKEKPVMDDPMEVQQIEGEGAKGVDEASASTTADDSGSHNVGGDAPPSSKQKERFVAHMSTLTDIFKVEDKVSTKKNQQEKEKDKGFKMASLFGSAPSDSVETFEGTTSGAGTTSLGSGLGQVVAAGNIEGAGGFSFGFADSGDSAVGQGSGVSSTWMDGVQGDAGKATGDNIRRDGSDSHQQMQSGSQRQQREVHGQDEGARTTRTTPAASIVSHESTGVAGVAGGTGVSHEDEEGRETVFWRPLSDVVAVAAQFVRAGKREDVETAWLGKRKALTQDFKRKHKDALKGRRGAGVGRGRGGLAKRRRG